MGNLDPRSFRDTLHISGNQARRDLGPQFDQALPTGCTKMDTATLQHASGTEGRAEQRLVIASASLTYTPASQNKLLQQMIPSPASTESLLSRHFGDPDYSPAGPTLTPQQGGLLPCIPDSRGWPSLRGPLP